MGEVTLRSPQIASLQYKEFASDAIMSSRKY
jgi:hypothetical protein